CPSRSRTGGWPLERGRAFTFSSIANGRIIGKSFCICHDLDQRRSIRFCTLRKWSRAVLAEDSADKLDEAARMLENAATALEALALRQDKAVASREQDAPL